MPGQDVPSSFGGCAGCLGGARGWNADQFGRQLVLLLVRHLFVFFGTGRGVGNGVVVVGWS